MAESVAQICNNALSKIGAKSKVSNIETDGTKSANECALRYPRLRRALLTNYYWTFATFRIKLAQKSDTPAFGFDHLYSYPTNWLSFISVHDNEEGHGSVVYKCEAEGIATNADELYARYVKDVTEVPDFSELFVEMLATRLASELALPIRNSRTLGETLWEHYLLLELEATAMDSLQDTPDQEETDDSWVANR